MDQGQRAVTRSSKSDSADNRNRWLGWEIDDEENVLARDHLDPSFAYMGYKIGVSELHELLESIRLAWDFSFSKQTEYIAFTGDYLVDQGKITTESSRAEAWNAFQSLSPERTRFILQAQALTSMVSIYLQYLKTTLSFVLPNHFDVYPKDFKVDLSPAATAIDLSDFIIKAITPEIEALGHSNYPALKRKCVALDIYPPATNRDLLMTERLINARNEIVHYHSGAELLRSGTLRRRNQVSQRAMWASIRGFSRVVNTIEKRAMKKYKLWSGYRMLAHYTGAGQKIRTRRERRRQG